MDVQVKDAETPWLDAATEKLYVYERDQKGQYGWMAASPLMSGLYSARACRPDQVVETLRMARRVTKCTLYDDRRLLRYLGYIRMSADLALTGSRSTDDCDTDVLRLWPDADLAGNPLEDAISTSGSWIEIASLTDDTRSMGVHWGAYC